MAAKKTGRLLRADVQKIVDGMSAGDVFRSQSVPDDEKSAAIFNGAAERLGYGPDAVDRVPLRDTGYLGETLSEALNLGGPKADGTEASLTSAATGDSAPS